MTTDKSWALEQLRHLDTILYKHTTLPLSLDPRKTCVTSFEELGRLFISSHLDSDALKIAINSITEIIQAQIKHFPSNIFWDFDAIFYQIIKIDNQSHCLEYCNLLLNLIRNFGMHSEIRFQYLHDFTFGFDWAKWVRKNPLERSKTSPFDISFLKSLNSRRLELVQLIRSNDRKYHKLTTPEPRNPYAFDRSPDYEKTLHQNLAKINKIPVCAWNADAKGQWNDDYNEIREHFARHYER